MAHPFDTWTQTGVDYGGNYDWGLLVGPYSEVAGQNIIFAIYHDFVNGGTGFPAPGTLYSTSGIRYSLDLGATWADVTLTPSFSGTYINPLAMWMTARGTLQVLVGVANWSSGNAQLVLEVLESDATLISCTSVATLADSGLVAVSLGLFIWTAEMMKCGRNSGGRWVATHNLVGRNAGEYVELSGLWRSTNDGVSWVSVTPPVTPSQGACELQVLPAGLHFQGRRSTDNGATWSAADQGLMLGGTAGFTYGHAIGLEPNSLSGTGGTRVSCAGMTFGDGSTAVSNTNWSRRCLYAFPGTTEAVAITTNGGLIRVFYTSDGGETVTYTDIDNVAYGAAIPTGFRGIGRLSDGRLVSMGFDRFLAISADSAPAGILDPPSFCNISVPEANVAAPSYLACQAGASFRPLIPQV